MFRYPFREGPHRELYDDKKDDYIRDDSCFFCKQPGHWANECPEKRDEFAPRIRGYRGRGRARGGIRGGRGARGGRSFMSRSRDQGTEMLIRIVCRQTIFSFLLYLYEKFQVF